jgi:hypothetical protein
LQTSLTKTPYLKEDIYLNAIWSSRHNQFKICEILEFGPLFVHSWYKNYQFSFLFHKQLIYMSIL